MLELFEGELMWREGFKLRETIPAYSYPAFIVLITTELPFVFI
jgi:hypothetical protein